MRPLTASLLALGLVAWIALGCSSSGASSGATSAQSSSAGTGGAGGAGAGGAPPGCAACAGACVDLAGDPRNCGACGKVCGAAHPLCDQGQCVPAPCAVVGPICPNDLRCCGMECCPAWKICCKLPGQDLPGCVSADAGACPTSCSGCE